MDANTTLADNGLPKMSDIYSNIQAPSLGDIGGSLGTKSTGINTGPTDAFKSYKDYIGGAGAPVNPLTTYDTLLTKQGIPQLQATSESLQGNINNLENQINRVTPNVTANTANSLTTEDQRQGMVNAKEFPLQQSLSPLVYGLGQVNTSLGTQEQNIGNEVNAVGQNNQMLSNAGAMGVTVAQDNAARTMTGYTHDQDAQLQGLLQKMSIEGTLDTAEWQTLSDLATNKQKYQQALGTIAAQQKYQTIGPGSNLVNTYTNQAVNPSMLTSRTGIANNI